MTQGEIPTQEGGSAAPPNAAQAAQLEAYQLAIGVITYPQMAQEAFANFRKNIAKHSKAPSGVPLRSHMHRGIWSEIGKVLKAKDKEVTTKRKKDDEQRRRTMWVKREHYLELTSMLMTDSMVDHAENALAMLTDEGRCLTILRVFLGVPPADAAKVLGKDRKGVDALWSEVSETLVKDLKKSQDKLQDPEIFLKRLRIKIPKDVMSHRGPPPTRRIPSKPNAPRIPTEELKMPTEVSPRPPTQRMQIPTAMQEARPPTQKIRTKTQMVPIQAAPVAMSPAARRRKLIILTSVMFALTLCVGLGVAFGVGAAAASELEKEVERLRDAGEPVRVADIKLPEIDKNTNAFPLYAEAAAHFRTLPDADRTILEEALTDMLAGEEIAPKRLRALAATVRTHRAKLDPLAKAVSRPDYVPNVDLSWASISEASHLKGIETAALVLAARAAWRAYTRKIPPPADDLTSLLRLGAALQDDPTVAGHMLRSRVVQRTGEALEIALNKFYFTSYHLSPMAKHIDPAAVREGFVRALQIERCVGLQVFFDIIDGKETPGADVEPSKLTAMVRRDAAFYARSMHDVIRTSKQGAASGRPGAIDPPWYASVSPKLLPARAPLKSSLDLTLARETLLQVALHLRMYKLKKGAYPGKLKELGDEPAEDPFSGKPFRYRRDGEGFVVYSVGPDGVDNGGNEDVNRTDEGSADMVFRVVK